MGIFKKKANPDTDRFPEEFHQNDEIQSQYGKYKENYSDEDFDDKMKTSAPSLGEKLCESFLFLKELISPSNRNMISSSLYISIICVLGYFILPIDIIPDYIPAAGFADDAAAIAAVIKILSDKKYDPIRMIAKEKAKQLFKK